MDLKGKLAIVTGGSTGIGQGIAEKLASAGADVVICARSEANVIKTATQIREQYDANCLGISCDVTDRAQVKQMIDMATEMGDAPIDILVNNAGIARFAPIRELDAETWDAVISTNLNGPFNMLKAALPHMHAGSFLFNVASMAAVHPFAGGAAYNASKAALYAFSDAVMQDLRGEGIRVCCMLSGSVNTKLEGLDGRAHEAWKMEPEDVGQVILDLLKLPSRAMPSRVDIRPTKTK